MQASFSFSQMIGISDTISAAVAPFFGVLIDRLGHRPQMMALCGCMLCLVHLSLAIFRFTPIPALCALGLGCTLYSAAVWPCVAYLVDAKHLGMAYGLSTAALNLGLTVIPFCVAAIRTQASFDAVELFFAAMAFVAALCCLWLKALDQRTDSKLSLPKANVDA